MLNINWNSLIYACLSDVANIACSYTVMYLVLITETKNCMIA